MNIYIKAMEIGYLKDIEGISYHSLKKQLEKELNITIVRDRELTFLAWFLESFESRNIKQLKENPTIRQKLYNYLLYSPEYYPDNWKNFEDIYNDQLGETFFLKGEVTKQYLDYLELQEARTTANEARISSSKALRIAQWSLVAAIIASLLPFGYTIYQDSTIQKDLIYKDYYTDHITEEELPEEPEPVKISENMKLNEFVQLSQLKQYEIVFNEGTYIDDIREENETFALYSVGSFWVEITYDRKNNKVLRLKPFEDGKLLDKFTIEN